jgi:hypothetical protein
MKIGEEPYVENTIYSIEFQPNVGERVLFVRVLDG